ncbi:MAG: thiamine pyrophosphate-dependent dehydrogenase E1 component subunit alpha [Myxococcota bacterium]
MELTREKLLDIYRRMRLIRAFEERLNDLVMAGKLSGFLHLYAGEEAVAVGVASHLSDSDYFSSTHRGHGHCIAKGVDVKAMMAELFGRATGVCKGKGGSMHIADLSRGMIGANGIVGAGIPLAVGAGLTAATRKTGAVSIAFFGDGASNQGAFHESANIAALWQLPVVFVCENNGYGEATPTDFAVSVKDIADRARGYGMPGVIADGMDFFDVYAKAGDAIAKARDGDGPTLLECKTYRFYGHYVGDNTAYRSKEEEEEMRQHHDPLAHFEERTVGAGLVSAEDLRTIDGDVVALLDDAVAYAEASPLPQPEEVLSDVYVRY